MIECCSDAARNSSRGRAYVADERKDDEPEEAGGGESHGDRWGAAVRETVLRPPICCGARRPRVQAGVTRAQAGGRAPARQLRPHGPGRDLVRRKQKELEAGVRDGADAALRKAVRPGERTVARGVPRPASGEVGSSSEILAVIFDSPPSPGACARRSLW